MADGKQIIGIAVVVGVVGIAYLVFAQPASASTIDDNSEGDDMSGSGNLSFTELQSLASSAGFSDDEASTAAAIALAESSGNPSALGDPTLGASVGLWQINLKAHPEYTQNELLDPQTNANAAYAVYSDARSSFSPWTTFKTGAYQEYLV